MKSGKVLKSILTAKGNTVVFRTPISQDVDELVIYANQLSQEDTFVVLSGEVLSREIEEEYLEIWIREVETGNRMQIFAFSDNKLVANAEVRRVTKSRKRQLHVGEIAISVAKDWRGQGIGKEILKTLIEEGKRMGLKLLTLTAFANNLRAIAIYESLGFIRAGEIPGAICYKDQYIGHVYMYLPLV
ncbi:MAG: GNAT family N-acetyltransferase [Patescibacteria group bacterium]